MCKLFFINTLDINDRRIRTVIERKKKVCENVIENDLRGKHSNHYTLDENIKGGIMHYLVTTLCSTRYLLKNTLFLFHPEKRSM